MNVLLLKAWLAEHSPMLAGSRLREVQQVDKKSLMLQLTGVDRRQLWLLVSILEAYPVLAVVRPDELPEYCGDDSRFVKALRFHLAGATLPTITQEGFDRSVVFEFLRKDLYGRETQRTLRVELVGRASNAYLLSEKNMVISMFKQVPAGRNSVRRVVTGRPLPPPPPLGKFIASENSVDELQRELDQTNRDNPMKDVLTKRVAGGDVQLWPRLESMVQLGWGAPELFDFVSRLQRGELTFDLFGRDVNREALSRWQAIGSSASKPASTTQASGDSRLRQIAQQLAMAKRAEELEQLGLEMLQRASSFANRETEAAFLKGWQITNADWADRLDPAKSAEENAGALIEYAQRLKRARPRLEELVHASESEAAAVIEKSDEGKLPPQDFQDPFQRDISKLERSGVKYLRYATSDGIAMLVGQSDRSNDELVRHYGSSRHLWLHVRDYPGSHVLLLTNGREVPQRSLEEAAVVAGYYSQGRGEIELEVSYTPVKQLRRPKGGKPGQVLKLSEKVVRVNPMRFEALREQLRVGIPG